MGRVRAFVPANHDEKIRPARTVIRRRKAVISGQWSVRVLSNPLQPELRRRIGQIGVGRRLACRGGRLARESFCSRARRPRTQAGRLRHYPRAIAASEFGFNLGKVRVRQEPHPPNDGVLKNTPSARIPRLTTKDTNNTKREKGLRLLREARIDPFPQCSSLVWFRVFGVFRGSLLWSSGSGLRFRRTVLCLIPTADDAR